MTSGITDFTVRPNTNGGSYPTISRVVCTVSGPTQRKTCFSPTVTPGSRTTSAAVTMRIVVTLSAGTIQISPVATRNRSVCVAERFSATVVTNISANSAWTAISSCGLLFKKLGIKYQYNSGAYA
jgi:hypothetical protein